LRRSLAQPREQAIHAIELGQNLAPVCPTERAHLEVLVDGHPGEDPAAFGALAEPEPDDLVGRLAIDPPVAQKDLALARLQQSRDCSEGRGLAGSVRADE